MYRNIFKKQNRELFYLSIVLILSIIFSLYSIAINFIEGLYQYCVAYATLPIAKFLINPIFLWLMGLLWITYRCWRKALKQRRELENIISGISPDVILITDSKRNIIMCNESVKKMFGYEVEEVINQKTDVLYFERGSNKLNKHELYDVLKSTGVHPGCAIGKKKNGDLIPLEITSVKLNGHKGTVLYLRDISDRKKAQESIKSAYTELMQVFNTSVEGTRIIDKEFNVLQVNETFSILAGMEESTMAGKKCYEVFDSQLCHTPHCLLTQILGGKGKIECDTENKRSDGTIVSCIGTATSLHTPRGELIGIIEGFRDISDRKKFEETLKQSEKRYQNLIENANDAIISINKEGTIVTLNKKAETMYGYTCEELLGKSVLLLVPPDRREDQKKSLEKLKTINVVGFRRTVETTAFGRNGNLFPVETSMFSSEIHGEYILTSFIRDISERKEMEQQLLQSEKLKSLGELSGGVAHDFNNILAAILGRVQLLKKQFDLPMGELERRKSTLDLKAGLGVIEKASLDGAETVRRIHEFSRRSADDKDLKQVDLNELLNNALEFTKVRWKNDAESKGIKIRIKKEFTPLSPILGSPSELREVFTNLVTNALDAMPRGGEMRVKSFMDDTVAVVIIEDTGVGIPSNIKDRIFDPFFTTKGPQSTGLGLSVSYGIINRHHGTITADSIEGKGTTFTLKFPVTKKQGKWEVKKDNVVAIKGKQKKARILVIDDEENVREILRDILTDAGHEVEVATNGSEGIEIFKKDQYDLVFTDLGMPVMSGWEVAEKVKSINKRVPVALVTGWNVILDEPTMNNGGIDLIMHKPFQIEQVLNLVQEGIILKDQLKAV